MKNHSLTLVTALNKSTNRKRSRDLRFGMKNEANTFFDVKCFSVGQTDRSWDGLIENGLW
jgi:hypothetical protein